MDFVPLGALMTRRRGIRLVRLRCVWLCMLCTAWSLVAGCGDVREHDGPATPSERRDAPVAMGTRAGVCSGSVAEASERLRALCLTGAVENLKDPAVARALGGLLSFGSLSEPCLLDLLEDLNCRWLALAGLARLPALSNEAVERLLSFASAETKSTHLCLALTALAQSAPESTHVKDLVLSVASRPGLVGGHAATLLERHLSVSDDQLANFLVEQLAAFHDPAMLHHDSRRLGCILRLVGKLGSSRMRVESEALAAAAVWPGVETARALGWIGTRRSMAWLSARVTDPPTEDEALVGLAGFLVASRPFPSAAPALLRLLDHPSSEVRWRAVLALGVHGMAHPRAQTVLITKFKDSNEKVRRLAIEASEEFTAPDPGLLAALRARATDESEASAVRNAALAALRARGWSVR